MNTPEVKYPDHELNKFRSFSNENLPLPKMPLDLLYQTMNLHIQATVNEVKLALTLLTDDQIPGYGKWLDKEIFRFDCISYEGDYDPFLDHHRIIACYPQDAVKYLDHTDPSVKNYKHKLSHRASAILNAGVEALDDKIWSLNKVLEEARP